jgi:hypothetical protein
VRKRKKKRSRRRTTRRSKVSGDLQPIVNGAVKRILVPVKHIKTIRFMY